MNLSKQEKNLLDKYAELIKEYNKVMNLTGIDEYEEVYEKHYYDAFQVAQTIKELNDVQTVADLGSGMGVPGIVLAILLPDVEVYLIEPMKKRCTFLEIVVKDLELKNVHIINERSEDLKEKFDLVVARAVAKLNILLEISCEIVKVNGYLIAMKGKNIDIELKDAKKAIHILKYRLVSEQKYSLTDGSYRDNVLLKKIARNEYKYPREFKYIKKSPL